MPEKKKKSTLDLMKEVRTTWNINPRTRVQENEKKDKKKLRQGTKKQIADESSDL